MDEKEKKRGRRGEKKDPPHEKTKRKSNMRREKKNSKYEKLKQKLLGVFGLTTSVNSLLKGC